MAVQTKRAETTGELDALFRLRHQVLVEEEGYVSARDNGRIHDRFDAFPTTCNFIALVDGKVVGGVRFAEASTSGFPADDYFDFSSCLPEGARSVAMSSLVVARRYRPVPRLTAALNGMGYFWAKARGATHILIPANPEQRCGFTRVGGRVVAPEFLHAQSGLPVLPMILTLDELNDRFQAFVERQGKHSWFDSFQRQFLIAGEGVFRRGDPGDCAYVVVHGEAAVLGPNDSPIDHLRPGDLCGGVSLLGNSRRIATIRALTDIDLMVLPRDAFHEQFLSDPQLADRVMELVARRLACVHQDRGSVPNAGPSEGSFSHSSNPLTVAS